MNRPYARYARKAVRNCRDNPPWLPILMGGRGGPARTSYLARLVRITDLPSSLAKEVIGLLHAAIAFAPLVQGNRELALDLLPEDRAGVVSAEGVDSPVGGGVVDAAAL